MTPLELMMPYETQKWQSKIASFLDFSDACQTDSSISNVVTQTPRLFHYSFV